jgi:hypothetical protein
MKTTIVVEDGGVATLSFGSSAATPVQSDSGASESAPVDAGAAQAAGLSQASAQASSNGASDGGMPPAWLLEAITQAGGLPAPACPEDIELTGVDAGSAPA